MTRARGGHWPPPLSFSMSSFAPLRMTALHAGAVDVLLPAPPHPCTASPLHRSRAVRPPGRAGVAVEVVQHRADRPPDVRPRARPVVRVDRDVAEHVAADLRVGGPLRGGLEAGLAGV